MKLQLKLMALIVVWAFIACEQGSGGSSKEEKQTPSAAGLESPALEEFERQILAGEIRAQAWTFLSGKATKTSVEGKVFLTLFETAYDNPCEVSIDKSSRVVVTQVDLNSGLVELGDLQKVNLTTFDEEVVRTIPVKKGMIKIQSYDERTLKGAMLASYDEGNYLEGSFEVVFCE